MPPAYSDPSPGLHRPGKVVTLLMCVMGGLWLAFAVGMHWAGVSPEVFALFCGNTLLVLHGQVWRLVTAPLMHDPNGFWHLFGVVLTLYFFAVPLEALWGRKRFVRFLLGLALVPSLIQVFFDVALPLSVRSSLVNDYWFGGAAIASGLTVAWALNHRDSVVRIYGILPVPARALIWMALGFPLIYLIFRSAPPEGIPALFGGCLAGWLLGGGSPSPLRKAWLKLRLAQLDNEARRENSRRKPRPNPGGLRVIPGGRGSDDDDRGPDGRFLN